MKLPFNIICIILLVLIPVSTWAQAETEAISQFRKTVFQLQQELLEVKNQIDNQRRELRSQKEELGIQVELLNRENAKMKKHLLEMDSLIFQMEDRLRSSSLIKLSQELQNLRNFNQAMILDSIDQVDQSEKLLLDILNQPESSLPKDLLILLLAQQKKRHQSYNESISYYSTLLSEFSGSTYFSQAIYEMSEILGETGKQEQQITLLAQLSSLSENDPYSLKANEKLKELGAEELFEEGAIKPDATADIPDKEVVLSASDVTSDTTSDIQPVEIVETTPILIPNDSTSDVENKSKAQIKTPENPKTIPSSDEKGAEEIKEPESTETTATQKLEETTPESDSTADNPSADQTG